MGQTMPNLCSKLLDGDLAALPVVHPWEQLEMLTLQNMAVQPTKALVLRH